MDRFCDLESASAHVLHILGLLLRYQRFALAIDVSTLTVTSCYRKSMLNFYYRLHNAEDLPPAGT